MIEAVDSDKVPRFPVTTVDELLGLLGDGEVVADGSLLWIKPDPTCILYYMHSALPDLTVSSDPSENVRRESLFGSKGYTKDSAKQLFLNSCNGVEFKLSRAVSAGEELLNSYNYGKAEAGDEVEEVESAPSPRRSKRGQATNNVLPEPE